MGATSSVERRPPPPAATPVVRPPRVAPVAPPVARTDAPIPYASVLDGSYSPMPAGDEGGYCSPDAPYPALESSYDPAALPGPRAEAPVETPSAPAPTPAPPPPPPPPPAAATTPPTPASTGSPADGGTADAAAAPAAPPDSGAGPADRAAAPGRGGAAGRAGRGTGSRGPPRGRGRERRASGRPAAPIATPRTGPAIIEREAIQLSVSAPAYPGGARIAVQPAPVPAGASAEREPVPDMPDYRADFAEAVAEGGQLYDRILAEARDIAAQAREQNEQLGRRHQQVLTTILRGLDDRLDFDRSSLRIGRDTMLLRMRRQAEMIRMRIAAAAGVAHGRLTAKRTVHQTEIDGLRTSGDTVVSTANQMVSDTDSKAQAAVDKLDWMITTIPRIYTLDHADFPKWNARNEAIQTYLPPRVERLKTNIGDQRTRVVAALREGFACLQCNVDNSRLAFGYATDAVELPARAAIDAAASGGRTAVNDAVEQLELAIVESHARGDSALVEQHDAMRKAAVEAAQQQAKQERLELADTAARQVAALGAVAGGQAQAIHRAKATLEKDSTMTEPVLAGVVSRSSKRLAQNIAGVAAVHPKGTVETARRLRGSRTQRAATFDRQQETTGSYSRQSLDRIVSQSLSGVEHHVGESLGRLYPVPASVRASANASLQPLDDAFFNGLADYRDSLATLSNSVQAAFTHTTAEPITPSERRPVPPPPPAARSRGGAPGAPPAPPAPPAPAPPASCAGCPPPGSEAAGPPESRPGADGPLVSTSEPAGEGGGASTASAPAMCQAPTPDSPFEFNRTNDAIALDPHAVAAFATFVEGVYATVDTQVRTRVKGIRDNMSVVSTNRREIVDQLSGVTQLQGRAIEEEYNYFYSPSLRTALNDQLRSIWAAGSTDDANVNEALRALDGQASESGFSALTASFNYGVEFDRARLTLLNMTPAQIADMRRDHGDALNAFANQLYGTQREIFQALIDGHPERARALELRRDLDANDRKSAEARGDANAALVDAALREGHNQAIYSDPGARHGDAFGFEDPEIVAERSRGHLERMETAFGFLPGVIEMGGGTSTDMAGSALFHYATRTVDFNMDYYRRHPPPPGSHAERHMREVERRAPTPYSRREMLPIHRLMIEQSLRHGVDSDEARGARLLRERRRRGGDPNLEGLDSALHIGTGDAREGGGYDSARRARGLAEAERRRDEIFLLSERFRHQLEGGDPPPATAAAAREAVRAEMMRSFPRDERARAVALGIVNSEEGDLEAVVEHAARTESTALLNRYLGRRDQREIAAFSRRYNETHAISIERRLGLFEHHWSWSNMNGAVFSGDTANTLEIAWMGVPQNPQERGEVALRVMDQTTEQAGGLGRLLAGSEFAELEANAARLRAAMGVTAAQVDSRGRIRTYEDPETGLEIHYGHFDENGQLRQEYAGDRDALAVAAGMARTYATSYTEATDRIASYITTALVVAAAIITTALTGGAAASLWIPMLVTAGAGLVGMGMTAAIKGGRYGRDEMVRDLAMTVVQTLTAGIGAAGSIAARGGMPALRMVASQGIRQGFRISEAALEQALLKQGVKLAAAAGLGAELGIAAVSGGLSGGVAAAFDPSNRGEDFWSNVAAGVGRGAAGAVVGAGVARGVSAGLGGAGNRLSAAAASRASRSALASGLSREQAIERALLAARRANWVAGGVTRSLASGASGSASRMAELGIEGRASLQEILAEGRTAFLQNALQGALEHGVDPGARNPFRRSGAHVTDTDLQAMPSWQRLEHEHMRAMAVEMVASRYDAPAAAAAAAPAVRPTRRADDGEAARPRGTDVEEPAGGGAAPRLRPGDESPVTVRAGAPDEPEAGPRPGPLAADDDEADILRSNRRPDEEITRPIPKAEIDTALENPPPLPPPPRPWLPAMTLEELGRQSSSHGTRVEDTADLTVAALRSMTIGLPVDSIIRASNPRDPNAAMSNYNALRQYNPSSEVLLARNVRTGEYAVVQGDYDSVRKPPPPSDWITERHVHPRTEATGDQAAIRHALPSGDPGDVGTLIREARRLADRNDGVSVRVSKIDVVQPDFSITETTFAVLINGPDVEISIHFRDPSGNVQELGPYTRLADYDADVLRLTGMDLQASRKLADGEALNSTIGRSRTVEPVSDEARSIAHFIARDMSPADAAATAARARAPSGTAEPPAPTSAARAEAHAAVRRLGLVGEPDSLARLTALINDPDLPPAVRSAVAEATLEATRAEMRRTGALAPGDDVVMLMRGVTGTRLGDYQEGGINLSKLGPTPNEDAGRGLYGSQDFESAERYTGAKGTGGQVLPLIVRRSELGNVIDVRSGTPLGDRWLQFIRANRGTATVAESPRHPHLSGVLIPGYPRPMALEGAGRGARFDSFLKSVADDPSLPDAVRAAARDPHITFMDLGGVASTGNDRGMLTDQWAMRSQHIADMFNRAHGFPIPGREGAEAPSPPARIQAEGDEEMRSLSPAAPAPPEPSTARLAAGMLDNLAGGRLDPNGHLGGLLQLAPETVTAFFTRVLDSASRGEAATLSDADLSRLDVDMARRSVPPGLAEQARAAFRTIADPDHPIHLRVVEAAPYSGFSRGLSGHLREAFERRAAISAARRFGYSKATSAERQLVRQLVQRDPEAVARVIRSDGSVHERAAAYARERVAQGERYRDALSDGYALIRAVDTSEFGRVRRRVNAMLRQVDRSSRALADLVRDQPETLLALAHRSPQLLSEFYVDLIFKRMAGSRADDGTITPGDFSTPGADRLVQYVGNRLISNALPVASELSVVWSLREMGLTLLKADSAQRGGANRPGLDIVAFGRLNGRDPTTGGPVRVMIADDKAYRMRDPLGINELQDVSAMQGPHFAENLRTTAQELRAQIRQIELIPGLAEQPGYPEYLAGARAAIRQMTRAAGEIERLPPVPTSRTRRTERIRSEAYARALAVILSRHHIDQVITSRHGNVNALARWLRWQGFLLEDEYLRRLAAIIAYSARG